MQFTWDEIQANAIAFSKKWQDAKSEDAEAQGFLLDFLRVFGVEAMDVGEFEYKIQLSDGKRGEIDYLWKSKIAIEMKSRGKSLEAAYDQLKRYMQGLPHEDIPDLWLVCDFENMQLHRRSTSEIWNFKKKDLRKHIKKFADIAGYTTERANEVKIEVNVKAAEKMAKLHDALKAHGYEGHDLEVYLVRLLFCMFADDTGIFPEHSFLDYVEKSKQDGSDLSHRLSDLFEVLNTSDEKRIKQQLLATELKAFKYINGALFEERLAPVQFNEKMRATLIECIKFDWSEISPAIFGAMFQGVMDKEQRRTMGAHYTSEENILKLINPLFLDELWKEFDRVKTSPVALEQFHEKLARLKFLDPACGCGNFLIITYRELRLLELEVLKMQHSTKQTQILNVSGLLKVNVEQFYGIELEHFACQVAQVGMWLIDHQMNLRVSEYFGQYYARLPLAQSATIVHGNALRIDWEHVVSKRELSYILGNPPFVGYKYQNAEQKEDMRRIFPNVKNLDYVCAWYEKASNYIIDTYIKCAFVSTNSIVQGEQTAILWKPLHEKGVRINFGVQSFIWNNEARGKAAVYCVIIGFSKIGTENDLNPYLLKAPIVFIERRNKPICDAPEMVYGNEPREGGNLIIEKEDYLDFLSIEPNADRYIRCFYGSEEFINNIQRYCLWLVDANPSEIKKMPLVMERIEKTREFRLSCKRQGTISAAEKPSLFESIRQPDSSYILIPVVSSERRKYIPIGFVSPDIIVNNAVQIIPNATLYHFGILTSNVHNAWTRAVCGRLKSDYRYSKDIVYNNFVWPDATEEQQAEIETLAQAVLDARANYPESSLADLYDPLTMPPDLLKAHQNLDRAVMKLYGFPIKDFTEADCVARLMELYQKKIEK